MGFDDPAQMVLAWLVAPLLALIVSYGLGLLLFSLAGWRPHLFMLPIGFLAALLLVYLGLRVGLGGAGAAIVPLALAVMGIAHGVVVATRPRRRRGGDPADRPAGEGIAARLGLTASMGLGVIAGAAVFCVGMLPVFASAAAVTTGCRTAAQQQAIEQVPELRQGLQTTPTQFASLWPESVALSEKVKAGGRGAKLASKAQALAATYEPVTAGFGEIATRLAALDVGQSLVTQMTDLQRASALAGESASAYAAGIAAKDDAKISEGDGRMGEATKLLVVIGERVPKLAQQYGVELGQAGQGGSTGQSPAE